MHDVESQLIIKILYHIECFQIKIKINLYIYNRYFNTMAVSHCGRVTEKEETKFFIGMYVCVLNTATLLRSNFSTHMVDSLKCND